MKKAKTITNEQLKKLIRHVNERDELILRIGAETGLRISDILNLKVSDIQENPMTITEQKTKKERTAKLSARLSAKLKHYVAYTNASECVFRGRGAFGHVHRATIHRRIKKALKTLKFEASAHSLRKLYAHNVLEASGSLESVRKALNHDSILTTATYLDIDLGELAREAVKIHGKSKTENSPED